ncbi:MAG: YfbM family protein [Microthrixaceae bacterium]
MSMLVNYHALSPTEAERVQQLDPDAMDDWLDRRDGGCSIDLDKAWHGLHFTLTGSAWDTSGSLGDLVLGGDEFGEDLGYGPPRWLAAERVATLSAELDDLSVGDFAQRIDFTQLEAQAIYPPIWDRADEQADLTNLLVEAYGQIREEFRRAASAGDGFVVVML